MIIPDMKLTVVLGLFCAIVAFAEEGVKPVCNSKVRGQFWPAEANTDRELLGRLVQQGKLEVCSYGTWRYGWRTLTVNVRDLAKEPARNEAAATPAQYADHQQR